MTNMKIYISIICLLVSSIALAQRPFINGINKISGTPNQLVTISGSHFSSLPPPTVYFGVGKVTKIDFSSENLIQVRVPATATYGPVTVVNNDGLMATSSQLFTMSFDDDSELATLIKLPAPKSIPTTGLFTYDLCICDFNGDDLLDAVVSNNKSKYLSLLLNTTTDPANPSFDPASEIPTANTSHNIECSDLNGDGRPDLVFSTSDSQGPFLHIYENTGDFGAPSFGTPSFTERHKMTIPTLNGKQRILKRVRIADFDGDGKKDVAVGSFSEDDNILFIYLNNTLEKGDVSFDTSENEITVAGVSRTSSLNVGDFDNDDRIDLVVHPVDETEPISILRNTSSKGSLSFEDGGTIGNPADRKNIIVADFNNDGFDDVASTTSSGVDIFENEGTITSGFFDFTVRPALTTMDKGWGIDVGDMNGDGWPDIIFSSLNGFIVYHENNSKNTVEAAIDFNPGVVQSGTTPVRNNRIGDLNDDGRPDVAFVDNSLKDDLGNFSFLTNDLTMTPIITPTTGVYCTDHEFIIRATEGHKLTYKWNVSGATPPTELNELDLNYQSNTGTKLITVIAVMADGTNGNASSPAEITHNQFSIGVPMIDWDEIDDEKIIKNVCVQEDLVLTSQFHIDTEEFFWYGPNGIISSCTTGICTISGAEVEDSGDYHLVIAGGVDTCSPASDPVTVRVSAPPSISIEIENCNDENITISAPDYTSEFDYQWRLDGGNIESANDSEINISTSGTYTLQVCELGQCGNENSCKRISNEIIIFEAPTSSFDGPSFGAKDEICIDIEETYTATSTKGDNASALTLAYIWTVTPPVGTEPSDSPVSFTGNSISYTFEKTGSATISLETTYADGIGCSVESKSITVSANPVYTADVTAPNDYAESTDIIEKCPSETLTLNFSEFISGEITTFSWDDAANTTDADLEITEPGTYTASYKANNGCEESSSIVVANLPGLGLSADSPSINIVDEQLQLEDGQLSVTLSVDAFVTVSSWTIDGAVQTGETETSLLIIPTKSSLDVSVSGKTILGCVETETVTILVGIFASKSFSPNGDGTNDWWGIINGSILEGCTVYIIDGGGRTIQEINSPFNEVDGISQIWDGTYGGTPVPEGVYFFVLKCADGSQSQTGSILIAR